MSLLTKRILFWGFFLLLVWYAGKPYRESGTDIGIGFVISLIGIGAILYFFAKWLFISKNDSDKQGDQ